MIEVTPSIKIPEEELQFEFIRASGPGGQNVNKVATAVQLRFDARNSPSLPEDMKERLARQAGSALTADGVLVLTARRYRTQEQNRLDAIRRLTVILQKAALAPKKRRPTRPSMSSVGARLKSKMRRGAIKRTRRYNPEDWGE